MAADLWVAYMRSLWSMGLERGLWQQAMRGTTGTEHHQVRVESVDVGVDCCGRSVRQNFSGKHDEMES